MIDIYIAPRTLSDDSVVQDVFLSNHTTVDTIVFPIVGNREDAQRFAANLQSLIDVSTTEIAKIHEALT